MGYLFDKAFQVTLVILFLVLFLILSAAGIFLISRMKHKGKTEEDEYYQKLDRYDAQDYLDFEDIVDEMVISDHHRRFVAAIRCNGFDLYSASSAQVASTMQGYIEFLNTITVPVTYRQYFVPMSMDYTRTMYDARHEEIERQLFHDNKDREELLGQLNQVRGTNLVAEEALISELEKIQEKIRNLEWRRMHIKEQMDFMDTVCDSTGMEPSMEQVYLVEWQYVEGQIHMEMTEEDIHTKAIEELSGICRRMIAALGRCNVTAYRMTTAELIEMFYQHSHPLSSMEFKMPDILNSPYFDSVITSDELSEKQKAAYMDAVLKEGVRMAEAIEEMTAEDVAAEVLGEVEK